LFCGKRWREKRISSSYGAVLMRHDVDAYPWFVFLADEVALELGQAAECLYKSLGLGA
jgi:hypothetical protein